MRAAGLVLVLVVAGGAGWVLSSRHGQVRLADGVVPGRVGAVVALPGSGWTTDDGGRAAARTGIVAVDERAGA